MFFFPSFQKANKFHFSFGLKKRERNIKKKNTCSGVAEFTWIVRDTCTWGLVGSRQRKQVDLRNLKRRFIHLT